MSLDNSFPVFSQSSSQGEYVYYVGQSVEDFQQILEHPEIVGNFLDFWGLILIPATFFAVGGWLSGFVSLAKLLLWLSLAILLSLIIWAIHQAQRASLDNQVIRFSQAWQEQIGAPQNFIATNWIATTFVGANHRDYWVITKRKEVYYLTRYCLLSQRDRHCLDACLRHFNR